jgi:hypothetical protein
MLQHIEFARILIDQVILPDRNTRESRHDLMRARSRHATDPLRLSLTGAKPRFIHNLRLFG